MPPDYHVTTSIDKTKTERIVRAKNEAAAIRHVVADTLVIRRATVDDAMTLGAAGGKVETAEEA